MVFHTGGLRLTTDNKLIQVGFDRKPTDYTVEHTADAFLEYLEWLKAHQIETGQLYDYVVDVWKAYGKVDPVSY